MAGPRRMTLSAWLALLTLLSAGSVAVVCGTGVVSMAHVSAVTRQSVTRQIALLNDASAFEALLYQKGFVGEYMLTGDRSALSRLQASKEVFDRWFARMRDGVTGGQARQLLAQIAAEYAAYDTARSQAVRAFDAGRADEARALLRSNQAHTERILALCQSFWQLGHADAERTLQAATRSMRHLAWFLVITSVAGALASLAAGFLLARRIIRPIYELRLQVESAAQRTRIRVAPSAEGEDMEALGERITGLIDKLEATDAVLGEQRRRLLQSEKLSAVGELAAKLAHEILNPLAGMKTAVQLMARRAAGPDSKLAEARDTAEALDREIARVEKLVRRLVDYTRPLSPRVEVCPVSRVISAAIEAAQVELSRSGARVVLTQEPNLPPLEVDPLLMSQALLNLLCNAAQARPGGEIDLSAGRTTDLGREHVRIEVRDSGPGIAPEHRERLFHPFFTTKPQGHGLGLATSHNIVLEHGGQIVAGNREDGTGAVFAILIPILR